MGVVMLDLLDEHGLQVAASRDEHPVDALASDSANDALADGVSPLGLDWSSMTLTASPAKTASNHRQSRSNWSRPVLPIPTFSLGVCKRGAQWSPAVGSARGSCVAQELGPPSDPNRPCCDGLVTRFANATRDANAGLVRSRAWRGRLLATDAWTDDPSAEC